MTSATVNGVPLNDVPLDVTHNAVNSVADLLHGVSHGDAASWHEILRRYGKLVLATARSFRLQEADVLDAVQITWLRLTEKAHTVQFPDRLGSWLVTTVRHECLRILRQAKMSAELIDMEAGTVADPSPGPEQHVVETDTKRIVWALVDELSARQRTLLHTLFTNQPVPYAEAARILGIQPGGIGPTRGRALRQLRDKLDEHEVELTPA